MQSLRADFELLVIEGAGSPAEINLQATDLANMRVARLADAVVLLVADIERGGAFAHLYGTWALLEPDDRARIHGFVLNRFRGDASLLHPGPLLLEQRTGIPTIAVVPLIRHGLPDEDGAAQRRRRRRPADRGGRPLPDGIQPRRVQGARADRERRLGDAARRAARRASS